MTHKAIIQVEWDESQDSELPRKVVGLACDWLMEMMVTEGVVDPSIMATLDADDLSLTQSSA